MCRHWDSLRLPSLLWEGTGWVVPWGAAKDLELNTACAAENIPVLCWMELLDLLSSPAGCGSFCSALGMHRAVLQLTVMSQSGSAHGVPVPLLVHSRHLLREPELA